MRKKSKAVILVSSMHYVIESDPESGKPEIIEYYNCTKDRVDSIDQKCANYSSNRHTKRWPMAIFFAILDRSTVTAYILFRNYHDSGNMDSLNFIKCIAMPLIEPHMRGRLANTLPQELSLNIRRILRLPDQSQAMERAEEEVFEKRKTCALCPPKLK